MQIYGSTIIDTLLGPETASLELVRLDTFINIFYVLGVATGSRTDWNDTRKAMAWRIRRYGAKPSLAPSSGVYGGPVEPVAAPIQRRILQSSTASSCRWAT